MKELIDLVNEHLDEYLQITYPEDIFKAMKYTLMLPGKRLRPVMCLETARILGCDIKKVMPAACAIEMLHVQSLIHDDLPCMDNDDMRRGKPSCHKKFGEATALLAGDALLTQAFQIVAASNLEDDKKVLAVQLLSQNSGVEGMLGGQVIDLKYESQAPSLKQLLSVHRLKTGALISAACLLGCIAAGASETQIEAASRFAYNLGIAFQIKDDILDVVGDSAILGKNTGSDAANDKITYVSIVGTEKAQQDVKTLTDNAVKCLSAFENVEFLELLADMLVNRNK